MQPTIETELSGAHRLLEPLVADPSLSTDVASQLKAVMQILKRLERSWPRMLPHLALDNARMAELLSEIASSLSPGLGADIGRTLSNGWRPGDPGAVDIDTANRINEVLRDLLARAVAETSAMDSEVGRPVRARIVAVLRDGLETRPW